MELWVCSDRPDGIPLRHVNVVEAAERMARVLHVRCPSSSDLGSCEHYDRDTALAGLLLAAAVGKGET